MITPSRSHFVAASLATLLVVIWCVRLTSPWTTQHISSLGSQKPTHSAGSSVTNPPSHSSESQSSSAPAILPHIQDYFDQVFSQGTPPIAEYPGLARTCARHEWREDVYLNCTGMLAGMTSIVNQVKVCLKMAVDSGSNLVLPAMPLRDSTNLQEFNFDNPDAYMTYDEWFDVGHLRDVMRRSCPKMKIVHPKELGVSLTVKNRWEIWNKQSPKYPGFGPLFWVGYTYGDFFRREITKLRDEHKDKENTKKGITLVTVDSKFVLFRITDDPTGGELVLWNDLSRIIRFREQPREVAVRLVDKLRAMGSYYGVHFRTENDTIWSSFEHQLAVDLDGLDDAWARYGQLGHPKPVVYIACGDEAQAERFATAGAERGWDVTHKWKLLRDDAETTRLVNTLAFDFQGAVDLAIMVRANFFFGITGSAFSSTISQLRDPTGRYRGSSLDIEDDAGAHSHLFFDGDAGGYPCCL